MKRVELYNVKASGSWERMDYEIDCENKES